MDDKKGNTSTKQYLLLDDDFLVERWVSSFDPGYTVQGLLFQIPEKNDLKELKAELSEFIGSSTYNWYDHNNAVDNIMRLHASKSLKNPHNLETPEIYAIAIFTAGPCGSDHKQHFYHTLNTVLREGDKKHIQKIMTFLYYFHKGLNKIKKSDNPEVLYRGISLKNDAGIATLKSTFKLGAVVQFNQFLSTSIAIGFAQKFLGSPPSALLKFTVSSARDISPYSLSPWEQERVLSPFNSLTVTSAPKLGSDGVYLVELAQTVVPSSTHLLF